MHENAVRPIVRSPNGRRTIIARRADGSLLTPADLPIEDDGQRWTRGRRDIVVEAVLAGISTAPEIKVRYDITRQEFAAWCRSYATRNKLHHGADRP